MTRLEKLIYTYCDHFHENFPLMLCRGMSEDELCAIIEKSIEQNRPYTPPTMDDADY